MATYDTKQCRICFDDGNVDEMISPCLCTGGLAYVHRKCLNQWRSENIRGRGFKFCEICQFEYVVDVVLTDSKAERRQLFKYYLLVIRDSTILFICIQLIILLIAFILKYIDKYGENIKGLYPNNMNANVIYYLSALTLLLAILGAVVMILIFCTSATGNRTTGNRHSRGGSGQGFFSGVVSIIIACALVGLVFGIIIAVFVLKEIMKQHASKSWLRQEAEKYVVRDFQHRRSDLNQYGRTIP